jgi:hypothetical protein
MTPFGEKGQNMKYYIINKNKDDNGNNEVHTSDCYYKPAKSNQEDLGWFNNEVEAKNYAKQHGWPDADGCYFCCRNAHTG